MSNLSVHESSNLLSAETEHTLPTLTLEEFDERQGAQIGDGRVFAGPDASPPFPEGIVADRNRIYVAGPAAFGDNGGQPSEVRVCSDPMDSDRGTRDILVARRLSHGKSSSIQC
jgi:hypothetical protein